MVMRIKNKINPKLLYGGLKFNARGEVWFI